MKLPVTSHLLLSIFLLSFLLLLSSSSSSSASARLLLSQQAEKAASLADTHINLEENLSQLMGSEECEEKDEECLKRRMIADAHLDYIYTQHHKP